MWSFITGSYNSRPSVILFTSLTEILVLSKLLCGMIHIELSSRALKQWCAQTLDLLFCRDGIAYTGLNNSTVANGTAHLQMLVWPAFTALLSDI